MKFIKKNKWLFTFILFVGFFFICYSFYYMNGLIEGAATKQTATKKAETTAPTTCPPSNNAIIPTGKDSNYYIQKTEDYLKTLTDGSKRSKISSQGAKEVAGVTTLCYEQNPNSRSSIYNCMKGVYAGDLKTKNALNDSSFKDTLINNKCNETSLNCLNHLLASTYPIMPKNVREAIVKNSENNCY